MDRKRPKTISVAERVLQNEDLLKRINDFNMPPHVLKAFIKAQILLSRKTVWKQIWDAFHSPDMMQVSDLFTDYMKRPFCNASLYWDKNSRNFLIVRQELVADFQMCVHFQVDPRFLGADPALPPGVPPYPRWDVPNSAL